MALFEKKFCDLCNEKVNLLTRQKLSDGFLCGDCKKKLSCLSDGWSDRSLADVKRHLQQREANKAKYASFQTTATYGSFTKLVVDAGKKQFYVTEGRDYKEENPEIFSFTQLEDYYVDESFSISEKDSDGDGIPDSRDMIDNRTGMQTQGFGVNIAAMAPAYVQPYLRRGRNAYDASGNLREVNRVSVVLKVKHEFINEVKFGVGNSPAEGYDIAAKIMQLCDQATGRSTNGFQQPMQQGFQQPMQQGFQQPMQQGLQQPMQQGFQQPMQQGFQQPMQQGFQQPMQQGFQQPMQQSFQQPMQQGFQQPMQQSFQQPMQQSFQQPMQAAAVMPFCPSCGAQNLNGSAFCASCGTNLSR